MDKAGVEKYTIDFERFITSSKTLLLNVAMLSDVSMDLKQVLHVGYRLRADRPMLWQWILATIDWKRLMAEALHSVSVSSYYDFCHSYTWNDHWPMRWQPILLLHPSNNLSRRFSIFAYLSVRPSYSSTYLPLYPSIHPSIHPLRPSFIPTPSQPFFHAAPIQSFPTPSVRVEVYNVWPVCIIMSTAFLRWRLIDRSTKCQRFRFVA